MPRYKAPPTARVDTGTRLVPDSTRTFVKAHDWLGGQGNDAKGSAERRAEDLVRGNAGLLADMAIAAEPGRVRGEPGIHFQTGTRVGAIPLRSPVTGRADFGLVVAPRFEWAGVGDLLASTGFRVTPELLPLPELPQSERHIPPWVLSTVVLRRLERLLDVTARRFASVEADLRAPRGAVDWAAYASRRLPHGRALDVPCRFPDLRDDELLRSAIHWTVRRHRDALQSAGAGRIVRQLLALCDRLVARLAGAPPRPPSARQRATWHRVPFVPAAFREGIQAIDWTADERGLAGLSDLAGLSWRLDMATFFEAWVETIAAAAAARTGALLTSGRQDQTRIRLDWRPRRAGSQRSLLPDVLLRREDLVVVIDAKYKRHALDIERLGWHGVSAAIRERHRADLLQALAYSTAYEAPRVVAVLVYPCEPERWSRLLERGRVMSIARLRTHPRHVEVALLAVPLGGLPDAPARVLEGVLRGRPAA